MAGLDDPPMQSRSGGTRKPADIEALVQEAAKHYHSRDAAALERMIRSLLS
jgi:hypothetical protein